MSLQKEIFGKLCVICKERIIYGSLDNKVTFKCSKGCFKGSFELNFANMINIKLGV